MNNFDTPLYHFHSPHPGGICGCCYPLPEPLEDVSNFLNGLNLDFDTAINKIREAAARCGNNYKASVVHSKYHNIDYIIVVRKNKNSYSTWKLIEFKKI